MTYIIRGLHKNAEEDDFENGCIGNGSDYAIDVSFEGASADEVIAKMATFVGAKTEDAELNVCDELGRVEFGRTEDANGDELTKAEVEQWKAGKIKAWYAVYTGYVERVERVNLEQP